MNLSPRGQVEPKLFCCRVMFSLVWESKVGFSIRQLTNSQMWFFTWIKRRGRLLALDLGCYLILGATGTAAWWYLEGFDSHSCLVLLLHHLNKLADYLVSHVVDVPPSLRPRQKTKKSHLQNKCHKSWSQWHKVAWRAAKLVLSWQRTLVYCFSQPPNAS